MILTYRLFPSGIMRAKATRDIRTGEEITISYGVHCKLTSTRDRLKYLQVRHVRQCQCAQCTARVDQFVIVFFFIGFKMLLFFYSL